MHRARWMAKVIYTIKMWIFRSQFKKKPSEERGIRDVATFSVIIHLKAWMTAPLAAEAPLNDFKLMEQLLQYPHAAISAATSKKLSLHTWYLSEELIGLALFDSRLPHKSKRLMLAAMEEAAPDHPSKRPMSSPMHSWDNKVWSSSVQPTQRNCFNCLVFQTH